MAIAFVAAVSAGDPDGSSGVTTGAIDTTGANFLIASVSVGTVSTGTAPTDSYDNEWVALSDNPNTVLSGSMRLWYAKNATTGTGHTFSRAVNGASLSVAAFSGVDPTDPFDVQTTPQAVGIAPDVTYTPTVNGCVCVSSGAIFVNGDHATIANIVSGGAFTMGGASVGYTNGSGGVHWDSTLAYSIQTTATQVLHDWIFGETGLVAAGASFKPATGGANRFFPYRRVA